MERALQVYFRQAQRVSRLALRQQLQSVEGERYATQSLLELQRKLRRRIQVLRKALGGKIQMMMTFAESPMAEQVPAAQRDKVIHARMTFGDQCSSCRAGL